jgi:formate hydrogenlyase transcriptional activator
MSASELGKHAADAILERHRALVDVADLIAQRRDLRGLFHDLAERLRGVVSFDFLIFVLHDPDRNLMCLNILENLSPGALPLPIEIGIDESSSGWVWENQRPLVFANIWQETRFPKVMQALRDFGIKSYGLLPLTAAERRLGALGFGSKQEAVYSEADLEFLQRVAGRVAVAVDNALNSQSLELYRQQLATGRAEAALRQSEERFRTVVESIDDVVFTLDREQRHTGVFGRWLERYGMTPQMFLGKTAREVLGPDVASVHEAANERALSGYNAVYEWSAETPKGRVHFQTSVSPLRDSRGSIAGIVGIGRDVTERKRAEETLRKSQAMFENLFEHSPDAVLTTDAQGRIVRANARVEKLFGYGREELLGQPVEVLVPERFRDGHPLRRRKYYSEPRPRLMGELFGRRKDGSEFPVELMLGPLETEEGEWVLGVVRDITERKQAEEALKTSEQRFRQIAENIREVFFLMDLQKHRVLYVSPAYEEIWGRSCESLYREPMSWFEAIHPEDRQRLSSAVQKFLAEGVFEEEYRVVRPDGSIRWIWDRGFPVQDGSSGLLRAVGIAEDITERKLAADALRASEQQLQSMMDNSTAVIYLKDVAGRFLRINRRFETVFATTRKETLGKTDYDLFPKDRADRLRANDQKVLEAGVPLEFEEVAPHDDGLHTYISIKVPLLDSAGKPYAVAGISTDITERKRAEETLLLEVTNVLVSNLDIRKLLAAISAGIRQVKPHFFAGVALYDSHSKKLRLHVLTAPQGNQLLQEEVLLPLEGSPAGWAFTMREPLLLDRMETDRFPPEIMQLWIGLGIKSACWLPLISHGRALGTLIVAGDSEAACSEKDVRLLSQIANQVAVALDNALAYQQISELQGRLAEEKLYLEEELRTEYNFEEIVGESAVLKRILKQVETVAPTEATVLIQGETGTGKELVARAIHNLSSRRERTFVKLNCAAIPIGLLESELFGHEKGAFTGAIMQKVGRLELAHRGTLFLDEVGDIPLELQPKLLRALQEKEFERLGSTRTIPVDARLVAATNRDLGQMVKDRLFRSDLYYRLRVFPIVVPPLRERPEDIPILVRYFAQKHAQRMNKKIDTIPPEAMEALRRWSWPGNVRELENLIERAVILSRGPALYIPLAELSPSAEIESSNSSTLEAAEREHILRVLRETNGVIGGPNGAAARLGLNRTTLNSKMRRLGISRRDI